MVTTRFLPVAGTHGWRGQPSGAWWQDNRPDDPPSPFLAFLEPHGFVPYNAARPYKWETSLAGMPAWLPLVGDRRQLAWRHGGDVLYDYMVPPLHGGCANGVAASPLDTRQVAHSHGIWPSMFAAVPSGQRPGLRISVLITVGSPVREDMDDVILQALPNIGTWVHLWSNEGDWWAVLGGVGDGKVALRHQQPRADVNICVPGGHTGVLDDPDHFVEWDTRRADLGGRSLLDVLRDAPRFGRRTTVFQREEAGRG